MEFISLSAHIIACSFQFPAHIVHYSPGCTLLISIPLNVWKLGVSKTSSVGFFSSVYCTVYYQPYHFDFLLCFEFQDFQCDLVSCADTNAPNKACECRSKQNACQSFSSGFQFHYFHSSEEKTIRTHTHTNPIDVHSCPYCTHAHTKPPFFNTIPSLAVNQYNCFPAPPRVGFVPEMWKLPDPLRLIAKCPWVDIRLNHCKWEFSFRFTHSNAHYTPDENRQNWFPPNKNNKNAFAWIGIHTYSRTWPSNR